MIRIINIGITGYILHFITQILKRVIIDTIACNLITCDALVMNREIELK